MDEAIDTNNITSPPVQKSKKSFLIWILIIIIVVLGGAVFYFKKVQTSTINSNSGASPQTYLGSSTESASNYFGFNLLKKMYSAQSNTVISPTSLSSALLIAANGGEGVSQQEILQALGLNGIGITRANSEYKQKIALSNLSSADLQLSIVNSVWTTRDNKFLPEYQALTKNVFDAMASKANSAEDVNNWVSSKTKGKIKQLVADPLASFYLVNAVYFKGIWKDPFVKTATMTKNFYAPSGTIKAQTMLKIFDNPLYCDDEKAQVISLPYKTSGDKQLSMVIFLPNKKVSLIDFVNNLDQSTYTKYIEKMTDTDKVDFEMPKFELSGGGSVRDHLEDLGIVSAINGAGLTKIADRPQVISDVIHKTYIKVDEEGTEAAAASAVILMDAAPMQTPKIIEMHVDRPFFFTIQDNSTNEILFTGTIQNPSPN